MSRNCFVDVILPLALPKTYTYSVPADLSGAVGAGMRVIVPFGKRKLYAALVYSVHRQAPEKFRTKDILQLIDDTPIAVPAQLKFWEWVAGYYMCTLGEVMKAALPSALKLESDTYVDRAEVEGLNLTYNEQAIMHLLDSKKKLTIQDIVAQVDFKNPMGVIKSLLNKQAVTVREEVEIDYQPKGELLISLAQQYRTHDALNALLDGMKRTPARQRLILALLSLAENPREMLNFSIPKRLIRERVDVSAGVLTALLQRGILVQEMQTVSRLPGGEESSSLPAALSEAQGEALRSIRTKLSRQNVVLLHGVTSSGKTELYIHLIHDTVSRGQQVLYLLPEIALTAQIIGRLRRTFGSRVGVYHSKFSDSQRVEVYNGVLAADPGAPARFDIILGVRSSVFLPYRNLGLIIVDEEHENTYKQNNPAPRYNARDAAVVLASIHNAKVLLGTATPSVETYFNAQAGKYGLVELAERYRGMELPAVRVVDVRDARKRRQMQSHFSDALLKEIDRALADNEQVILFQNRRGFSPFIECGECAWVPHCDHCDVTLTYHKSTNRLVCHYCGFSHTQPHQCLACGSGNLQPKGFGTEKVEDELRILFPAAAVERVDLDSTRSRAAYERIIADFEQGRINILIGTQMITKGLDFDRVSLVGILNADNMLNFPDFRAFERSFQLMSQVSGRAGRSGRRGLVILQTAQPAHPVIRQIASHSYSEHYASQVEERKRFHYPPYCRLVGISLKHKDRALLEQASTSLAQALRHSLGSSVLGPEPPPVGRVQGLFIMSILVKIGREQPLARVKELIGYHVNGLKQRKELYALVVAIDVDPQ